MAYHPQKVRSYGHVTALKFCRLPWCSASGQIVKSDGEMALILPYYTEFGSGFYLHYFTEFLYYVVLKQLLVLFRF